MELTLPRDDLGTFPTPVEQALGIWVKREDRSGTLYGGNKVRKLRWLLPEVRRRGGDLMTLGAIGSHHLLACSMYGNAHGVRTHALVIPQHETPHVMRNFSVLQREASSIWLGTGEWELPFLAISAARAVRKERGHWPMFVWAGGSTPLGSLGWVEGALELGDQVRRGECPEPDALYVALGSGGTCAGLLVGLEMAGLKTQVHAVRVVDRLFANGTVVTWLARRAARLIADNGGPSVRVDPSRLVVHHDWFGAGYGEPTPEGTAAIERGLDAGLAVEPTYTGKTLAAALAGAKTGKVVMFLDSLSSAQLP
ncbi:MAG: pyridoxal-phosphate dependent enzyme [Proteobacteria bacterium]|nr:pyridoxal-phosphate dependent enzyme [Pseudomonadota bacterium]MCP4916761.1 pyridoxal-phosphate dependent enzyme [Pseudomonadota bacterium]